MVHPDLDERASVAGPSEEGVGHATGDYVWNCHCVDLREVVLLIQKGFAPYVCPQIRKAAVNTAQEMARQQ